MLEGAPYFLREKGAVPLRNYLAIFRLSKDAVNNVNLLMKRGAIWIV